MQGFAQNSAETLSDKFKAETFVSGSFNMVWLDFVLACGTCVFHPFVNEGEISVYLGTLHWCNLSVVFTPCTLINVLKRGIGKSAQFICALHQMQLF